MRARNRRVRLNAEWTDEQIAVSGPVVAELQAMRPGELVRPENEDGPYGMRWFYVIQKYEGDAIRANRGRVRSP